VGLGLLICQSAGGSWLSAKDEPKPEELVAKHLEALGTPEARAAVKTRLMNGEGSMAFLEGETWGLPGPAQFASDAGRARFEWRFGHHDYDAEQLVFDGEDVMVAHMRPPVRSPLATFIVDHGQPLLREGIWGGVTNVGWALSSDRKLRLKYRGLKELQGKKVHVLRYQAAKSGNLRIDLGFDPETYRHVVTDYSLEVAVRGVVTRPNESSSSGVMSTYWKVIEEFDDFRPVDGITLPHAYKVRVTYNGRSTLIAEWKALFSEVKHNQDLGPDVFKLR